jgi:pimeloyl-ACP methyl ester carboxylesterase
MTGTRAGYAATELHPERVDALVVMSAGYATSAPIAISSTTSNGRRQFLLSLAVPPSSRIEPPFPLKSFGLVAVVLDRAQIRTHGELGTKSRVLLPRIK